MEMTKRILRSLALWGMWLLAWAYSDAQVMEQTIANSLAHNTGNWTVVQHVANNTAGTCGLSSGVSCTMTVASTHVGDVLLYFASMYQAATAFGTVTAMSGDGAWTHCPNGRGQVQVTTYYSSDCYYRINSTGGATSIVATVSTSGDFRGGEFYELASTDLAGAAYDTDDSAGRTAAADQPGIGLTLSGGNDIVIQYIFVSGSAATAISTPYTLTDHIVSVNAAQLPNSNTAPQPTWANGSAIACVNAIAFKGN
jgi:hypothetical protein